MLLSLVLCLVGLAVAQVPVPCTSPAQWEGRIYDYNEQQKFRVGGRLSYDSVYHRERFVEEMDEGGQETFLDRLSLYDQQIEFVYNFRAHNCTRQTLTRPWRDFGIRPNDRSYGEAYIGSSAMPEASLLVTIWGGNFTTPDNETISYRSVWSYRGCIPIARTDFSQKFGVSHLSFFDVTAGISDPNVFIPHRECLSSEEWAARHTRFGLSIKNKKIA